VPEEGLEQHPQHVGARRHRWSLWHTIQHEAIAGKIELLPTFRNYLTFILTAPFLGAKPAAALLAERSE
jgi:hypothetical protein